MKVYLTRDSVAAGDDVTAPNAKSFEAENLEAVIENITKLKCLPSIAGGKAAWTLSSRIPIAVFAQEWGAPKMVSPFPLKLGELDLDQGTLKLHLSYHAQMDPEVVLSVLKRLQLTASRNPDATAKNFSFATLGDEPEIGRILTSYGLTISDRAEHRESFIVARLGEEVAGVVGLELIGRVALLRSLAITEAGRGKNLERQLCERMIRHAHKLGVETLYLLAESEDPFFIRLGFAPVEHVPDEIRDTEQFASLDPATLVCLTKDIA